MRVCLRLRGGGREGGRERGGRERGREGGREEEGEGRGREEEDGVESKVTVSVELGNGYLLHIM